MQSPNQACLAIKAYLNKVIFYIILKLKLNFCFYITTRMCSIALPVDLDRLQSFHISVNNIIVFLLMQNIEF